MTQLSEMHRHVNQATAGRGQRKDLEADLIGQLKEQDPKLAAAVNALSDFTMPENNFWDSPKEYYQELLTKILDANDLLATAVAGALADEVKGPQLRQHPKLSTLVVSINRDISTQLTMLENTYNSHKDRSGAITDPDDMLRLLAVSEAYESIGSVFNSLIVPVSAEIMEIIGVYDEVVELAKQEQAAEAQAQEAAVLDPNVITDVEVREVPNSANEG